MDISVSVIGWIIGSFIELREELLWTFLFVDAPLILGVLVLPKAFRLKRKQKKEKAKMRRKRKIEKELKQKTDEEIIEMASKVVEDAESMIHDLDGLPEGMPEGLPVIEEIQSFRKFLVNASSDLRKRLRLSVGPETIIGVAEGMRNLYEGMNKGEEIRIRTALLKRKAAYDAKLRCVNAYYSLQGLYEVKQVFESFAEKLGYDPDDTSLAWGQVAKQLTGLQIMNLYADASGIQIQPPRSIAGH